MYLELYAVYKNTFLNDLFQNEFTGLIDYEDVCLDLNDEASTDTYCPKGYIDFTNASLSVKEGMF